MKRLMLFVISLFVVTSFVIAQDNIYTHCGTKYSKNGNSWFIKHGGRDFKLVKGEVIARIANINDLKSVELITGILGLSVVDDQVTCHLIRNPGVFSGIDDHRKYLFIRNSEVFFRD